MNDFKACATLAGYINQHGRQQAAKQLDYLPQTLDKLALRGAVVINGAVYAPVTKRVTRACGKNGGGN